MIRVLRLLEYSYPDNRTAEDDMNRWGVPANGSKKWGKHDDKVIRSAIITDLNFEDKASKHDRPTSDYTSDQVG